MNPPIDLAEPAGHVGYTPGRQLITGLTFGTFFAATRSIFVVMCAAFDLTALAIIYWDLESAIAHFIFK